MKVLFATMLLSVGFSMISLQAQAQPAPSVPVCRTSCQRDVQTVSEAVQASPGVYRCLQKFTVSCAPFNCANDYVCKTSCQMSSDCAEGYLCNNTTGACVPAGSNTCASAFQVKSATGYLTDCRPYTCLSGMCRSNCASNIDCTQDGFKCVDQKCVYKVN